MVALGEAMSVAEDLNPLWDPSYIDIVLNDLIDHKYHWRDPNGLFTAIVECACERSWIVDRAIQAGRRIGLVIEGDRGRGYRYLGFQRIHNVHLRKALAWPPMDGEESLTAIESVG